MNVVGEVADLLDQRDGDPIATAWVHFGSEHLPPAEVAHLHLSFLARYKWGLLKVMHDFRASVEAPEQGELSERWSDVFLEKQNQAFSKQIDVLKVISAEASVPFVETVFTPFQVLVRAIGRPAVGVIASQSWDALNDLLKEILELQKAHLANSARVGASGYFLSTNTFGDHRESLVIPYDQELLSDKSLAISILHAHGPNLGGISEESYGCDILNVCEEIQAADTMKAFPSAVRMFGVNEHDTLYPDNDQVRTNLRHASEAADGRLIFGPGCTVHSDTPSRVFDVISSYSNKKG